MAILNKLFDIPIGVDIVKRLGNILISGMENEGSRRLYSNMLMELLKEKKTVIIANGALSEEEYKKLGRFISPHLSDHSKYDFKLSESCSSFNAMSAFDNEDQKSDFVVELLSMATALPEAVRDKAKRLYGYAISTMELAGSSYTLRDIAEKDIDDIAELVEASSMSEPEKRRSLRFLEDTSTYSAFIEIENCVEKLESSGVLDMLSGSIGVKDMLSDGGIVMLSGMLSDDFKKKELLFNSVFYVLSKCVEKAHEKGKVTFLIKKADFIAGDYIKSIMNYGLTCNIASYIFAEDISSYIKNKGNTVLNMAGAYIVFTQGSAANAAFWSEAFGSRDVNEKSFSYTNKKSWNPLANMADNGGVVPLPRKRGTETVGFQKVNKPIYRPEVFTDLGAWDVMIYMRGSMVGGKYPNTVRKKTRIEG